MRSVEAVLEASRILQWAELHIPALIAVNILAVETWQADYLSHQMLD